MFILALGTIEMAAPPAAQQQQQEGLEMWRIWYVSFYIFILIHLCLS